MLAGLCVSCADGTQGGGDSTQDLESAPDAGSIQDFPTLVLADSPAVSIGGSDSRPDYLLGQTLRAIRLPDGKIVIGDDMRSDIRFYDDKGGFVRTIGGEGQGPGEFERLTVMERTADGGVAAWDRTLRRFTYFSATGDVLKVVPVPGLDRTVPDSTGNAARFFAFPNELLPLEGGRFAAFVLAEPNMEFVPPGPFLLQDTLPVYLSDASGEWSEIAGGPYPGLVWYFFNRSGRIFPGYYAERLEHAAADSIFFLAPTRSATILKVSARTGETTPFATLPGPARPLTEADRQVIHERMLSSHSEEAFEAMEIPSDLPMFSDLLVSADGDLWVQLFQSRTDTLSTWVMYDPRGEPFGKLTVPASFRVTDVGDDYVLGVTMDSLDQETVQLYRISPDQSND